MVGIFSTEDTEYTTDLVIDWIGYLGGKSKRINGEDFFHLPFLFSLEEENDSEAFYFHEEATNANKDVKQLSSIWFRRWNSFSGLKSLYDDSLSNYMSGTLINHLKREFSSFSRSFFHYLNRQCSDFLDFPQNTILAKFDVLTLAKHLNIPIPDSIITNNIRLLEEFISKHGKIITKSISEVETFVHGNHNFHLLTHEVVMEDLDFNDNELFFPSLFQEYIEKEYEIRSFYLDGSFYSMAIFSQSDKKTQIDFRNYNWKVPNRVVPYTLPIDISEKLEELMNQLNLRHGSIDLIRQKDGKIFFLEVNPVGQFGMVSNPCNYFLEKKVAEFLIEKDEKRRATLG